MGFGQIPDEEVTKNRNNFLETLGIKSRDLVSAKLTHGAKTVLTHKEDKGKIIANVDGLISRENNIYLMVTVADCLPILLYDSVTKTVGIMHAGWRGIIKQIIPETLLKLRAMGIATENLTVGIGPGICQKHFVVQDEVLRHFLDCYPQATFVRNNHGYVDLKKAVLSDLKKMNIGAENIEVANICPACDNGRFGSFRKEGKSAPAAAAIIGMRDKAF